MPVQDGAMGNREGGEGGKATGRGRIAGGEENGDEAVVIRCWWGCGGVGQQG